MSKPSAIEKLFALLEPALRDGSLVKLTLSARRGADKTLKNVEIRPVVLRDERQLSFVYHHANRDVTKNFPLDEALPLLHDIIGREFRNAHLFTTRCSAQLEIRDGHGAKLLEGPPRHETPPPTGHDRAKQRAVNPASAWLMGLGVTGPDGRVARGMEAKFRQIHKFVEVFAPLFSDAKLEAAPTVRVVDMGCGKGYLTFAIHEWLRQVPERAVQVRGIEARPELVQQCQAVAAKNDLIGLTFSAGTIEDAAVEGVDVLLALHACDTATDDALARGIQAGARLILVSPCCHKELRGQLVPPPVLAGPLRHGILRERQAEFVTDALRAALLEWAGYETRVFEFISTEHTAKNLMIAAVRRPTDDTARQAAAAVSIRNLAAFYGVKTQRLAAALGVSLVEEGSGT